MQDLDKTIAEHLNQIPPVQPPESPPVRGLNFDEPEGEPLKTPTGVSAWNLAWIRRILIRQTFLGLQARLDREHEMNQATLFRSATNTQLAIAINQRTLQSVLMLGQLIALGLIVWRVW